MSPVYLEPRPAAIESCNSTYRALPYLHTYRLRFTLQRYKENAMSDNPFVGTWTYRSFLNNPDVNKAFNDLEFGRGTIVIEEAPMPSLKGTIGGPGWSLALKGARAYGNPMYARFQGSASSTARSGSTTTKAIWCRTGRMALTRSRPLSAPSSAPFPIQAANPVP
jgi:hypothetical protein